MRKQSNQNKFLTSNVLLVTAILFWLWAMLFWLYYFAAVRPQNDLDKLRPMYDSSARN